jgi:hypothetical protein
MQFTKAKRKKAKLRLALVAPSGAGKTLSALMIAKGLGGRWAVIDTERGSASLYSEKVRLSDGTVFEPPEFDSLDLAPPYSPERYVEAIKAAEAAGYDGVIVDSASHEWNGSGGCLEINDDLARARFQGNTWAAWNVTTPRHREFIDAMTQSSMHVIATSRTKTETAQTDGPNGKKKVVKLGMKTEQRDGFEYEFTVVLDLVHDGHFAMASKDRTGLFAGDPQPITEQTGKQLLDWLENGEAPPDLQAVLEGIKNAASLDVLKANYEAAVQMLPESTHDELARATSARKRALSKAAAAAPTPEQQFDDVPS